jgi:transcription initiation factor TFIID subunit 8
MVSPKRRFSSAENEGPDTKRSKIDTTNAPLDLRQAIVTLGAENYEGDHGLGDGHPIVSCLPNAHFQSRQAIQRSIALVLSHDGFESTTPEALESFTQLVETCEC